MKRVPSTLLALALAASSLAAQGGAKKIRIAVQDFDYSSVQGQVQEIFGNDVDVGRGIANLVQDALVKSGKYDVAQRLTVPEGQRADAAGAAQRAQSAGVDAVVMGAVIGYGKSENQTAGMNVHVGGLGFGGIGKKTTIAFVNLQVTFVPAGTPAPAAVATGQGTAKGSGTTVLGDVSAAGLSANGEIDMTKSDFQKTTLGKAQSSAIDALVQDMLAKYDDVAAAKAPPAPPVAATPAPAPAAAPVAAGPMIPAPAAFGAPVAGPFTWALYQFKGNEHYLYNISSVDGGQTKTGQYRIDATPAANGAFQLAVNGTFDARTWSSTTTVMPGQGVPPMALAGFGPIGALLFNPGFAYMFGGQTWQIGNSWSVAGPDGSTAFKVAKACSYGGVSGLLGEQSVNGKVVMQLCISPNVALPLYFAITPDDGAPFTIELVNFHE